MRIVVWFLLGVFLSLCVSAALRTDRLAFDCERGGGVMGKVGADVLCMRRAQ